MPRSCVRAALLTALLCLPAARAGAPPARLSAAALSARIDAHVAAGWKGRRVVPAPPADDAELVRRLHLDLTGRIPDILAARDFVENPDKDKRAKLIDRLLADDRHALHLANVWRAWLLPESGRRADPAATTTFETWLRLQVKGNARWSEVVTGLLTGGPEESAGLFTQANENAPEKLAAASSRLFLGVKLECAQCHNHPFARWSRKQFWEFAGFFADGGAAETGTERGVAPPGTIRIPGTSRTVSARFLDGKAPAATTDRRRALAAWLTARDNPSFARAAANRLWEYFLGVGLVEPVDDFREENPASHPALLALLGREFAAHDFDVRYLIRAIVGSKTYQRTSRQTHPGQADARLFARMRVRGLSPEQLFDSLALATCQKDDPDSLPRAADAPSPRADFLRRFPNHDRRAAQQTTILQALYLMNGKLVSEAASLAHNQNLAILARAKGVPVARRIDQLFLLTLARRPTAAERARLGRYVGQGGPGKDPAQALCDVFWVLLNTGEFSVNH
jgi:hypothetical protein